MVTFAEGKIEGQIEGQACVIDLFYNSALHTDRLTASAEFALRKRGRKIKLRILASRRISPSARDQEI
jgi:hypothetical protein